MSDLRTAAHGAAIRLERLGLLQWVLRQGARRRLEELRPGAVTVVIANWNSNSFLEVALAAVRRFADRETDVLVVDNHSRESPAALASRYGARLVAMPANLRHSVALDVGFLLARTEFSMSLDVDAFPFSDSWMPTFLGRLEAGYSVVGCEWYRPYAHPCCLAMRTSEFVTGGYTFRPGYPPFGADDPTGWDVGEAISKRLGPARVAIIPKTGTLAGDGFAHAIYGDVLFHNCFGTRHLRLPDPDTGILDPSENFAMTREVALRMWEEALRRFGPGTWGHAGVGRNA